MKAQIKLLKNLSLSSYVSFFFHFSQAPYFPAVPLLLHIVSDLSLSQAIGLIQTPKPYPRLRPEIETGSVI